MDETTWINPHREANSDYAHATQERMVNENSYDCWNEAPLNEGNVVIHRIYRQAKEKVKLVLEKSGLAYASVEAVPEMQNQTEVSFNIDLNEVNLPQDLIIGQRMTFEAIRKNLSQFENMGKNVFLAGKYSRELISHVIYRVAEVLNAERKNSKHEIDFPLEKDFETFRHSMQDTPEKRIYRTNRLDYMMATYHLESPLEALDYTKGVLEKLIRECKPGTKIAEAARKLLEEMDFTPNRGSGLYPAPAIYHDDWMDPRFEGPVPGEVALGRIPKKGIQEGQDDASSAEAIRRKGYIQAWVHDDSPASVPPNMTNLTIFELPVLPEEIHDWERETGLLEKWSDPFLVSPKFAMVYCDQPKRLNPVVVQRSLDERYHTGGWILVTKNKEGKTVRLVPKPKEEWKVTSTKRKDAPFIRDTVIGEE